MLNSYHLDVRVIVFDEHCLLSFNKFKDKVFLSNSMLRISL